MVTPETLAQTLDELQGPLLAPGQVAAAIDHTAFAFERIIAEFGRPAATSFDPAYHTLNPRVTVGVSRKAQIAIDGFYQLPTLRSRLVFADPDSRLAESWEVASVRARARFRPSPKVEIDATVLWGRSHYEYSFPRGNGPHVDNASASSHLELNALWLSRPDAWSRPRRADLDGLRGPLLRRRGAMVRWEGMARRYDATQTEEQPGFGASFDAVNATDRRMRLGAAYGLSARLEVSGDGYWQPAFTVAEAGQFQPAGLPAQTSDDSRRLFDMFGARMKVRWRPVARLEAFGEATSERQTVTVRPASVGAFTDSYRQRRLTTGASWLSRSPRRGGDLLANLDGLYRPLLELGQLRLDAVVHVRRDGGINAGLVDTTTWRVEGTVGVWPSVQIGAYAGRFRVDRVSRPDLFPSGVSLGGTMKVRPARRVEGFASYNYHPSTYVEAYPAFNLPRGDRRLRLSFYDFAEKAPDDDASLRIGIRLVF